MKRIIARQAVRRFGAPWQVLGIGDTQVGPLRQALPGTFNHLRRKIGAGNRSIWLLHQRQKTAVAATAVEQRSRAESFHNLLHFTMHGARSHAVTMAVVTTGDAIEMPKRFFLEIPLGHV